MQTWIFWQQRRMNINEASFSFTYKIIENFLLFKWLNKINYFSLKLRQDFIIVVNFFLHDGILRIFASSSLQKFEKGINETEFV